MMYLKLMSGQDMPDSDTSKDFSMETIRDTDRLEFASGLEWAKAYGIKTCAIITCADGVVKQIPMRGNAYVLNAQGKTISTKSPTDDLSRDVVPLAQASPKDLAEWLKQSGVEFTFLNQHPDISANRTSIQISLDDDDPRPDLTVELIHRGLKGVVPLHRIFVMDRVIS